MSYRKLIDDFYGMGKIAANTVPYISYGKNGPQVYPEYSDITYDDWDGEYRDKNGNIIPMEEAELPPASISDILTPEQAASYRKIHR